jgi:pyruvate/2-oxoglutarate dehydrogenase complex dihydrolipoamide dehydrogenase (E3) component
VDRFDAFVIGGGGTGSEVAFRLGRDHGMRVAIAERDKLGGECNHYGCVPTKVMLRSAQLAAHARDAARFGVQIPSVDVDLAAVRRRVRAVIAASSGDGAAPFERFGITVMMQEARLVGTRRVELADGTAVEADRIIVTTGSEPSVPPIPGLADGPYWTNREAIWSPDAPPASFAIVGAGAIGVEFAQIYARFGSRVTLLEAAPHLLPSEDEACADALRPVLARDGIEVLEGVTIEGATHAHGAWTISLEGGRHVRVDQVLVATGRRPAFGVHDLAAAGVDLDDRGRPLLDQHLRTTADGIWVAGDATGELLFTHVGTYEAGLVVDDILGRPRARDYRVVPRVTFCEPEVASVGLTEREARQQGIDVRVGTARIADNERSTIDGRSDGVVKVVADADGQVLGGHVVVEGAAGVVHELVAMMAGRVPAHAVGNAIHAYPTLSESVKAALLDV